MRERRSCQCVFISTRLALLASKYTYSHRFSTFMCDKCRIASLTVCLTLGKVSEAETPTDSMCFRVREERKDEEDEEG